MRWRLLALLLVAALPGPLFADGTTLYVRRFLVAAPGDVSLGDVVRASGALSATAQEALSRSIVVAGANIVYVPADSYGAQVDAAFGPGAIVVGQRTIIVPRGSGLETQAWMVDRIVDTLQGQGVLGSSAAEMSVSQVTSHGNPPQDGIPTIQVTRSLTGGFDVVFSDTGSNGGSISGRLSVAAPAAAPAVTADQTGALRSGAPVTVVFHKGLITIQMPGRTLGTASRGERVTVSVTESPKNFSGVLIDGSSVEVDLP